MAWSKSTTSSPPRQPLRLTAFVVCVQTIEIMFGRLKDWRRSATRYDRSAHTFFSAITLAAAVTFWLGQ
jgi:transposase